MSKLSSGLLETDRLVLRRRLPGDARVFRQLWTERDPRVPAHRRINAEGRPSIDDIAERIRLDDSRSGLLAVIRKDTGRLIGYCGLTISEGESPDEPELAYELLQSAQGRGFATEAARAVVECARDAGYERLWASVWDWNVASRKVLAKLGFSEPDDLPPAGPHGRNLLTTLDLRTHSNG